MNKLMQIQGCPLVVKEIKGQRVVSTADIADLHKVSENTIRQNFKRNRQRFINGIDFYEEKGKIPGSDNLSLSRTYFTESGYLMLVKSLTGDLAWEIQRALVNSYFRVGQLEQILSLLGDDLRKLVYYRGLGLTQRETAKLLDMSKDKVQDLEHKLAQVGYVVPGRRVVKTSSNWRFR